MNKVIAWGLLISLALVVLGVAAEDEVMTQISGIGIWIFNIWAAVTLFRTKDATG